MLNKYDIVKISRVIKSSLILLSALVILPVNADILTLFTTAEERQIIDANRFKVKQVPVKEVTVVQEQPKRVKPQKTVNMTYVISGITSSNEGSPTVWINKQSYQSGDELGDESKVHIVIDDAVRVQITAPDGEKYYATSGETLEISYLTDID